MNQRSPKSSLQSLKRLVVLTLISLFIVTSLTGVQRTFAVPQDPLILQANTAITLAQSALNIADAKTFEGKDRLAELQEFSSALKDPDINSLANMTRLTGAVSRMFDEATNKKLQDELGDAGKKLSEANDKLVAAQSALANGTTPEI